MAQVRITRAIVDPNGQVEVDLTLPSGELILNHRATVSLDPGSVARSALAVAPTVRALPSLTGMVEIPDDEYNALRAAALAAASAAASAEPEAVAEESAPAASEGEGAGKDEAPSAPKGSAGKSASK